MKYPRKAMNYKVCTLAYMYAYAYVYLCVCVCWCMYICACVHVCGVCVLCAILCVCVCDKCAGLMIITIEKCSETLDEEMHLAFDWKLVILVARFSILTGFCPVSCCYHKPCVHVSLIHTYISIHTFRSPSPFQHGRRCS